MLTTIVVTPRERFSLFAASLRSLFATIAEEVPVIVYDAGAPAAVKAQLRELRRERPFDLHECDSFLLPPQVRNRAHSQVTTRYTCFCDNDLFYQPGWLEALEQNAEANQSAAVAPVTLIGPTSAPLIHHAGSELSVHLDKRGRPRLQSLHRLDGTPYEQALSNDFADAGLECDEYEYHCALVRTEMIDQIGGHDERQIKHDHLNDCLRIKMLGGRITFEKQAVVTYHAFVPFEPWDWQFFFHRWTLESSIQSDEAIGKCWGAYKNYSDRQLDFVTMHRRRAVAASLPAWLRKLTSSALRSRLVDLQVSRLAARHAAASPDQPRQALHVPEAPPWNALQLAQIPGAEVVHAVSQEPEDPGVHPPSESGEVTA